MYPAVGDSLGLIWVAAIFCVIGIVLLVVAYVVIGKPKKDGVPRSGPDTPDGAGGDAGGFGEDGGDQSARHLR